MAQQWTEIRVGLRTLGLLFAAGYFAGAAVVTLAIPPSAVEGWVVAGLALVCVGFALWIRDNNLGE